MYRCVDGCRNLRGAEFDLARGAIGMMTDDLVAEYRDDAPQSTFGIVAFDQWDCDQRIWLLERAAIALLTDRAPPRMTAIHEATVAAVFAEVHRQILMELDDPSSSEIDSDSCGANTCESNSWRASVAAAYECQQGREAPLDPVSRDAAGWSRMLGTIVDRVMGPTTYDRVEAFRDGAISRTRDFLASRGLTEDYLTAIPPIRTVSQVQASIDAIQSWVFTD